ncbi:MAG: hypothetical protein FRX49_11202 [Trebouxia sp. A1-2]|nr:MAG: hypothetical protein FRX49_11202 [Trebouxia sp. A1-2]
MLQRITDNGYESLTAGEGTPGAQARLQEAAPHPEQVPPLPLAASTGIILKAVCQVLLTTAAKAIDSQAVLFQQNDESRPHLKSH